MQLVKDYLGRKHRSDLSDRADGRIAYVRTGWALYTVLFMLTYDHWYEYGIKKHLQRAERYKTASNGDSAHGRTTGS